MKSLLTVQGESSTWIIFHLTSHKSLSVHNSKSGLNAAIKFMEIKVIIIIIVSVVQLYY